MSRVYTIAKADAQRLHAIKRAEERLQQTWTLEDVAICVNRIRSDQKEKWAKYKGTAVLLRRQSRRVSIWAVRHRDVWSPMVYDRDRKTIVTILPIEGLVYDGDRPVDFKHKWEHHQVPEQFPLARRFLRDRHATTIPRGSHLLLSND